ncbi:hypothetical protein [Neorhodopirellula lusitana]|uniref:hypothetical protein n=1 Tax=Neorhodopirellula lusitana TaxID=445327 RepID=UPI00384BDBE6
MEKQLTVAEIAEQWSGVVATELIMRKEERFSGVGLGLPGASAEFEASQSGDVVVFIPQESKELNPISISDTDPEKGDVVWLLSPNLANDSLVHRAISVSVIHDGFLVYEFDEPIVIAGTSGAPIVNEEGLIVAVHRGGGTNDGKTIGVGTLANRFLPSLNGEIKKNSP